MYSYFKVNNLYTLTTIHYHQNMTESCIIMLIYCTQWMMQACLLHSHFLMVHFPSAVCPLKLTMKLVPKDSSTCESYGGQIPVWPQSLMVIIHPKTMGYLCIFCWRILLGLGENKENICLGSASNWPRVSTALCGWNSITFPSQKWKFPWLYRCL